MKTLNKPDYSRRLDLYVFGGNREKAIVRDGSKCVRCGLTRQQHKDKYGFDITVDHIDGRGTYTPRNLRNNSLDNLQTLCIACHAVKDSKITKVSEEQVIGIRHLGGFLTNAELGAYYGISESNVGAILTNKIWKSLPNPYLDYLDRINPERDKTKQVRWKRSQSLMLATSQSKEDTDE